jgi:hypothetical protein
MTTHLSKRPGWVLSLPTPAAGAARPAKPAPSPPALGLRTRVAGRAAETKELHHPRGGGGPRPEAQRDRHLARGARRGLIRGAGPA